MLLEKRARLDKMLETIDKTLQHLKGELEMTNNREIQRFRLQSHPYEQEARRLWGDKAVDDSNTKIAGMSQDKQKALVEEMESIYRRLATLRGGPPDSEDAQIAIKAWYDLLNTKFSTYSPETFRTLGQMYVDDERFTESIDRFGKGLAVFMRDAMAVFADKTGN